MATNDDGGFRAPVDLDNCDREPIHVPGAIQPHGVLLAVSEPDLTVRVVSANLERWFGVDPGEAIGRHLSEVTGARAAAAMVQAAGEPWHQRVDDIDIPVGQTVASGTIHRTGSLLVIEAEFDDATRRHTGSLVRDATTALQVATTVPAVAAAAAESVRALSGFDRVMVYRFDDEWNGEVVAEHKADELNSFLGLHYPSTDIPAQARELYRRNWIRLIPDISYLPVQLLPGVSFDDREPLDLSLSTLRSVSPIHVEYLTNMGVTGSMSVSIVIDGELWGLIACHHYSGVNRPTVAERNACEFIGQLTSLRIAESIGSAARIRATELGAVADSLGALFTGSSPGSIDVAVRSREADVLKLAGASGFVLRNGDRTTALGLVPPPDIVDSLCDHWRGDGVLEAHTSEARTIVERAGEHLDTVGGALAMAMSDDWRDVAVWFRPELVRTVDWGGDPHNAKIARAEGDHVRLSPRKSFDLWRETVRGRSEAWHPAEIRAASRLSDHLRGVLLRREREAAEFADDFQRTMLPEVLPTVPGYVLDAFYSPATGRVGGDWYDAFVVADGTVAALLGDVAGHGLPAASEMAQLRNVLRAYLFGCTSPGAALDRLGEFMLRVMPRSMATVVCALLDAPTGRVTVAHAGHLPALVIDVHGGSRLVETSGNVLLGTRAAPRADSTFVLAPGEAMVLYSDGLVERRTESLDDGLARLQTAATEVLGRGVDTGTAGELAVAMGGDEPDDDLTVLVVARSAA